MKFIKNGKLYNVEESELILKYVQKVDTGIGLLGTGRPLVKDEHCQLYKSKKGNYFILKDRKNIEDIDKEELKKILTALNEVDLYLEHIGKLEEA